MFKKLEKKISIWVESDVFSLLLFSIIILFFTSIIIYKLYTLQIVGGEKYYQQVLRSSSNYIRDKTFRRGNIYFKNGEKDILMTVQEIGYTLIINNQNNKFLKNNNPEDVYQKISKIINIDEKRFVRLANIKDDIYIEIKNKISLEDIEKIKKLHIKGLEYIKENWRVYPFGKIGSKIIGFLDKEKKGVTGLEKYYNSILEYKTKKQKRNIFLDMFLNQGKILEKKEVVREGNLFSTVDVNVQDFLEEKVKLINDTFLSKQTLGIIIKPKTGEIVAMADNENIDFNKEKKYFKNNMIESRYEPGSIIKPLIVTLALDSKSINTDFSYNDTGCITVRDDKVCNYDKRARGPHTDLIRVIQESLNVGMVNIGRQVKKKTFLNYFIRFGLSEETGIDLPGEISQNIASLNYPIDINYATSAFGQGVSFSPISTLRSLSIIASDGFLVRPHIIKKISYNNLIPDDDKSDNGIKVISQKTVDEIKKIMVTAVQRSKQKQKYQRKMYNVAAKTGTAQIADEKGGYKENVNLHTFFGFFPAYAKPEDRYAIILYTFEPQAKYSSQTLTKPFFDIVDFLISYYKIKPDRK